MGFILIACLRNLLSGLLHVPTLIDVFLEVDAPKLVKPFICCRNSGIPVFRDRLFLMEQFQKHLPKQNGIPTIGQIFWG